jgi:hypothetical protein
MAPVLDGDPGGVHFTRDDLEWFTVEKEVVGRERKGVARSSRRLLCGLGLRRCHRQQRSKKQREQRSREAKIQGTEAKI